MSSPYTVISGYHTDFGIVALQVRIMADQSFIYFYTWPVAVYPNIVTIIDTRRNAKSVNGHEIMVVDNERGWCQ